MLPKIVDRTGTMRRLGHKRTPYNLMSMHAHRMGVRKPDSVPQADWVRLQFDVPIPTPVKDQGEHGSCNGQASTETLQIARLESGYPHVELSADFVYANLCGGVDQGSSIGEALLFLETQGVCEDLMVPRGLLDARRIPEAARKNAARYRIEQGPSLKTVEDVVSAVILRQPINGAVHAGDGFDSFDAEGVVQSRPGFCDHAITIAYGFKISATHGPMVKLRNSWGSWWGVRREPGTCWIPVAFLVSQPGFEAYSVRAVLGDPEKPVPVPK